MLIYLFLHLSEMIKSINHTKKMLILGQNVDVWFQDVVYYYGLSCLCDIGYKTINYGMLEDFVERWCKETSYFHILHGEMFITFDDVSCLLHLLIWGRLLNHPRINKFEAYEFMVNYLGVDSSESQKELDATRGAHARFSCLEELHKYHLVAEVDAKGDDEQVLFHK